MSEDIDRSQMLGVDRRDLVQPFSKVDYWDKPDRSGRMVQAFIPMEKPIEGARMGLAIDASGSMQALFGRKPRGIIPGTPNHVQPVARLMAAYFAKLAADGRVVTLYWAVGPGGKEIQVLGDLTAAEAENHAFDPPDNYGGGTRLLPALQYFTDGTKRKDLHDAPWAFFVFITDGQLEDVEDVKQYCTKLAVDIEAGRRSDLKLAIIGLGDQVDEDQLEQLDNLETGTSVDLWDAEKAEDLQDLSELFREVMDESTIIIENDGIIRDPAGNIVVDYRDTGLPALLRFTLPYGAKAFSLEFAGQKVVQPLP